MNRNEARQAILEKAMQSIRLGGIRATKMDDLAAALSISKRTLYELYPSKVHLIAACIKAMQEEWRTQTSAPAFLEGNTIERIRRFLTHYITTLYQVHLSFWTDLYQSEKLKASCQSMKEEWLDRCIVMAEKCQREGCFFAELTPSLLSERFMSGLFQSRLDGYTDTEQHLFCNIILRGASTPAGISLLDQTGGSAAETLQKAQGSKKERYETLLPQIASLIEDESDDIANMANVAAALMETFRFWWAGFYRVEGNELVLGPFQGPLACTRIGFGKGVCGTAWKEARTVVVPDVDAFPGHIACSTASRSEIVVPLFREGQVVAVLDIDSERPAAFDETDAHYLERLGKALMKA